MFCHRCGKQLPAGSEFCNRCGSRMKTQEERLGRPEFSAPPPPPRPSRRRPVVEPPPPAVRPERPVSPVRSARPVIREPQQVDPDDDVIYQNNDEGIIFRIHPAFFEAGIAYMLGILASLVVAALVAWLKLPFWVVVIFAIGFLIPGVVKHIERMLTIYTLTKVKVVIQSGLFDKKMRNIPLRNIQDVYVNETFKERMAGIGDVVIDSAATSGKMAMENINHPRVYADMILDQLQRWN